MENIEAIIFDMDGVIFDTEKLYFNVWERIFKKYGYDMTIDVYSSVMGIGRDNVKKVFKEIYGQDIPIEQMYKEKDEEVLAAIEENKVEVKAGVKDILEYLEKNELKVVLATSAKRDRVYKQLIGVGLLDKFDYILCGDEIINPKPNPEIFIKVAKKLEIKEEHCLVIEDSYSGLNAAFNAKMKVVHVPDLIDYHKKLKNKINIRLENVIELKKYI